jgi:hypothetical protein
MPKVIKGSSGGYMNIRGKRDFKIKIVTGDKEYNNKRVNPSRNIIIIKIYVPSYKAPKIYEAKINRIEEKIDGVFLETVL